MRSAAAIAATILCATASLPALADDLLETLSQKGVLTMDEYEKLKAQKSGIKLSTDDGFKFSTADGSFWISPGTLQQLDVAWYHDDNTDLANGTELRRSRISLTGGVFKDWLYKVEWEFSTGTATLTDGYVTYAGFKPFMITVGQMKQPFSMEQLAADRNVTFMERALPFAFVPARAPGVMLGSSGANWTVNGGVFGEPLSNAQTGDEGYGLAARATFAPVLTSDQVVHIGLSALWRKPTAENSTNATGPKFSTVRFRSKPESDELAQRFADTGEIHDVDRYVAEGAELAGEWGPASLQGEYQIVQVERETAATARFTGWYAQFAYTLTGEARPYKADRGFFDGIRPRANVGKDGWGAFEIAARLSEINLGDEDVNGGRLRDATLGLNWYLNPFLRTSANVVKVLTTSGGPLNDDQPIAYQMRFQLAF